MHELNAAFQVGKDSCTVNPYHVSPSVTTHRLWKDMLHIVMTNQTIFSTNIIMSFHNPNMKPPRGPRI